jgi:hypothetical protein
VLIAPLFFGAMALLVDAVRQGEAPPVSQEELLGRALAVWDRVAGRQPTGAEVEEISRLLGLYWRRHGGLPVRPRLEEVVIIEREGEVSVVPDPFVARRAGNDLLASWPEDPIENGSGAEIAEYEPGRVPRISFPAVQKDDDRFYVDLDRFPAMRGLRRGQGLTDAYTAALHPPIYWQVTSLEPGRAWLAPVPPNPLSTGIGAGGATITDRDVEVLSGDYERKALAYAKSKLESGTATIDDVRYLLLGTVAVNFGPNGAQGGWYNPSDRSNRGGRKGLSPEQVVHVDARWLADHGFAVPVAALEWPIRIAVDDWGEWVQGPPDPRDSTPDYNPDPVAYIAYIRKMTRGGIYRYDDASIAQFARRVDRDAMARWGERMVRKFLSDRDAFVRDNPYMADYHLADVIRFVSGSIEGQEREVARTRSFDVAGEDATRDDSVRDHLYHPERRVSCRSASLAVLRAELGHVDPKWAHWRGILMDWIRWGKADYFAHERALKFFERTGDAEALELGLSLPDPTNRRYAAVPLIALRPERALEHFRVERHPEVVASMLLNLQGPVPRDRVLEVFESSHLPLLREVVADAEVVDVVSKVYWSDVARHAAYMYQKVANDALIRGLHEEPPRRDTPEHRAAIVKVEEMVRASDILMGRVR